MKDSPEWLFGTVVMTMRETIDKLMEKYGDENCDYISVPCECGNEHPCENILTHYGLEIEL